MIFGTGLFYVLFHRLLTAGSLGRPRPQRRQGQHEPACASGVFLAKADAEGPSVRQGNDAPMSDSETDQEPDSEPDSEPSLWGKGIEAPSIDAVVGETEPTKACRSHPIYAVLGELQALSASGGAATPQVRPHPLDEPEKLQEPEACGHAGLPPELFLAQRSKMSAKAPEFVPEPARKATLELSLELLVGTWTAGGGQLFEVVAAAAPEQGAQAVGPVGYAERRRASSTRSFPLYWDAAANRIWWGWSFSLDVIELMDNLEQIIWHPVARNGEESPDRAPRVWQRRGEHEEQGGRRARARSRRGQRGRLATYTTD